MDFRKMLDKMIKEQDKPANKLDYQRFFKEPLENPVQIKTAILRKISNQAFKEIKHLPKIEIFEMCDKMLESGKLYYRFFAFEWTGKLHKQYAKSDFARFERWLKSYVYHWGSCDHLCSNIGKLVKMYPELSDETIKWTKSLNRWLRRAAAVSLIDIVSHGQLLARVFETAEILLKDPDDMVQKGYGWMLKDASAVFPEEVFEFVMKNKTAMPRTALRYAIERYPRSKRKQAMK